MSNVREIDFLLDEENEYLSFQLKPYLHRKLLFKQSIKDSFYSQKFCFVYLVISFYLSQFIELRSENFYQNAVTDQ